MPDKYGHTAPIDWDKQAIDLLQEWCTDNRAEEVGALGYGRPMDADVLWTRLVELGLKSQMRHICRECGQHEAMVCSVCHEKERLCEDCEGVAMYCTDHPEEEG